MVVSVPQEFVDICKSIVAQGKTETVWAEIESDDMFQAQHFVGGFDATEMAFCFSYFDPSGQEYWFQLTLPEIREVALGQIKSIESRLAER